MSFFFFNDTATTEIYTLSLHDALPISSTPMMASLSCHRAVSADAQSRRTSSSSPCRLRRRSEEHTSNSSHLVISYAVFCLKKKKSTIHYCLKDLSLCGRSSVRICDLLF